MPWSSLWQGGGGGSVAGAFIAHLDYTHAQMLAGDTPREILAALGPRLVELERNGANSFCCGAGWQFSFKNY